MSHHTDSPDIVTEAREWIDGLPPEVFDVDGPSRRVRDLVAEVEQLRTQLAERTDPELADELRTISGDLHTDDAEALLTAARLLGGTDG